VTMSNAKKGRATSVEPVHYLALMCVQCVRMTCSTEVR